MTGLQAQTPVGSPKLVIGLTIDQFRADYMEAFSALYGQKGFKRLMDEGRLYYNGEYDFADTDVSSAVAAIHTGTTPYYNGIVANQWMDRQSLRMVKSVDDPSFMGIYTSESSSPKRLAVSTLSDELTIASQGKAIVYSVAPFREMAVLSAGHNSNGAFWLNDETGKWCGTTYYGNFPQWATTYNDRDGLDVRLRDMVWEPALPVTSYQYVTAPNTQLTFRHSFSEERTERYRKFKTSPYVNDEVNRFVDYCLSNSDMGKDAIPDLLSLGYYAGNYDGKSSTELPLELQDTYVRLDRSLGELLDIIDRKVGLKHTLFVITSTGATPDRSATPATYKVPGGEFHMKRCMALLNMYLMAIHGQGQYVETYFDRQLYFNKKLIEDKHLNFTQILNEAADFIVQMSGVKAAYTSQRLLLGGWTPEVERIRNGFNIDCSGDIYVEVKPGWTVANDYNYQTKVIREAMTAVPVFFFGYNVKPAILYTPLKMAVIAPTLSYALRIRAPNAASASPLLEAFK